MTEASDDGAGWDDPDRAVQIEDDNPESLAGGPVEFDEAADDDARQEDFPNQGAIAIAGVEDFAAGGAILPATSPATEGGEA